MNTILTKTRAGLLLVAGALLVLVGGFIVADPATFYAANGIDTGGNVNLLNELKAPAGLLLVAGCLMIGAIFRRGLAHSATALAALIYLSYAVTRGVSMAVDGMPAAGLVQATALEGLLGLACLAILVIEKTTTRRNA